MAYTDRLYFQKTKEDSTIKETIADFDIYLKDLDIKPFGSAKELYANDWNDEHGKEEFIPDKLKFDPIDVKFEFACKGNKGSSYNKVNTFIKYLSGLDGSGAELMFYSTYLGYGRRKARFKELSDSAELISDTQDGDILFFSVSFTINDPITDIDIITTEGVKKLGIKIS